MPLWLRSSPLLWHCWAWLTFCDPDVAGSLAYRWTSEFDVCVGYCDAPCKSPVNVPAIVSFFSDISVHIIDRYTCSTLHWASGSGKFASSSYKCPYCQSSFTLNAKFPSETQEHSLLHKMCQYKSGRQWQNMTALKQSFSSLIHNLICLQSEVVCESSNNLYLAIQRCCALDCLSWVSYWSHLVVVKCMLFKSKQTFIRTDDMNHKI